MFKVKSRLKQLAFWLCALILSAHSTSAKAPQTPEEMHCHKLTRQARDYIKAGEPERALSLLHEALSFDPASIEAHSKLADALFLMQQFKPAIHACNFVITNDKEHEWEDAALYRRGCCYGGLKQYDLALKDLDEVIKRQPTSGRNYYAKGEVLRLKGSLKLAVASYHEALKRKDFVQSPEPIYLTCAACERELADRKGERAELTELISKFPSVDAHRLRGDSYMKDKLFKQASQDFETVLALEPANTHCKEALAACKKELGLSKNADKSHALK
jgi:tetratricopeptide (TPR) repeat protein